MNAFMGCIILFTTLTGQPTQIVIKDEATCRGALLALAMLTAPEPEKPPPSPPEEPAK